MVCINLQLWHYSLNNCLVFCGTEGVVNLTENIILLLQWIQDHKGNVDRYALDILTTY